MSRNHNYVVGYPGEGQCILGYPGEGQCIYGKPVVHSFIDYINPLTLSQAKKYKKSRINPSKGKALFNEEKKELEQRLNTLEGMYEGLKASNELNKKQITLFNEAIGEDEKICWDGDTPRQFIDYDAQTRNELRKQIRKRVGGDR